MKTSVKSILFFVLLMLLFSMRGGALNSVDCSSDIKCQISALSSGKIALANFDEDSSFSDKLRAYTFSDVEMGVKPVSESNSISNAHRLRRILEMSDSLKEVFQRLCLRENLLVLDKCKSFRSDKDPDYAQSSCDYYIFALRRILI